MSALQGPRGGRARGRGSATPTQRGNRGGTAVKPPGRATAAPAVTLNGPSTRQFKPLSIQNGFRDAVRGSSLSPAHGARGWSPPRTSRTSTSPPQHKAKRNIGSGSAGGAVQKRMGDTYQKLKKNREQERKDAIRDGVLADPDKPTSLANAITPVGTCQDMCPPFERAERIVQLMVDGCEKKTSSSGVREPCEEKMVKRFRRSAAGYDEQLPSDIRPPLVLQKTLDYLIDEVVGGSQPLAVVHKFVWDRTRGIRNDFSIQQVTKVEDLRVAIDCFERIARFHILSLHQLSRSDHDNGEFDHHQEREQLNNTLLSLMYYYDDSRYRLKSPNEAEFRAYCIIFEIRDQRPDLEDRAQQWPLPLLRNQRVQTALRLYAAAGDTSDEQGPLRPRASFAVAHANTGRFWNIVQSNAVSYTMACVTEIYFNLVRRMALEALWKAYKGKRAGPTKMEDWILADLTLALGFDSEDQTQSYVEEHGFLVAINDSDQAYVDLGSVSSRYLSDTNPRRKQVFSKTLVEAKRLGRTLPAIINGISATQAQTRGLVEDASDLEESSVPHRDSLFVTGDSDEEFEAPRRSGTILEKRETRAFDLNPSTTSTKPFSPSVTFGTPQHTAAPTTVTSPFGKPSPVSSSKPILTAFGKPSTAGASATASFSFGKSASSNSFTTPSSIVGSGPTINTQANTSAAFGKPVSTALNVPPRASTSLPASDTQKLSPAADRQPSTSQFQLKPDPAELVETKTTKPASPFSLSSGTPTTPGLPSTSPFTLPKYSFGTSPLFNSRASSPTPDASRSGSPYDRAKERVPAISQEPHMAHPTLTPTTQPLPNLNPQLATPKPTDSIFQISTAPSYQPPFVSAEQPSPPQHLSSPKQRFTFAESHGSEKPDPPASTFSFTPSPPKPTTGASLPQATVGLDSSQTSTTKFNLTPPLIQPPQLPSSVELTPNSNKNSAPPNADIFLRPSTADGEGSTTGFFPSPAPVPKPRTKRSDARPAALNALSEALMLDDEGLLQQFIEYTIGPIVGTAIRRVEEERSWQQARDCRVHLLAKKYFRSWKKIAWKLVLLRKGKERRKNFAESMRDLAQSVRRQPDTDSILGLTSNVRDTGAASAMPSSAKPSKTRKSLPVEMGRDPWPPMTASKKRKYDDQTTNAERSPPRRIKTHHKRSRTVASVSSSDPTNRYGSPTRKGRSSSPARLSFIGRTDTTHTDYFRLKALGLDPDTPMVPLTSTKRSRDKKTIGSEKRSKQSPHQDTTEVRSGDTAVSQGGRHHGTQTPPRSHPTTQTDDDSDEALFARLRQVRSAISDSITWFQSERAKSERTSSGGYEAPLNETPAQKRLRELKTTPSRTEQRLRATGAHGLLPKAWASNSSWRDADGRITTFVPPTPVSRSDALPAPKRRGGVFPSKVQGSAWGTGPMGPQGPREENGARPEGAGSSVEDAIEL